MKHRSFLLLLLISMLIAACGGSTTPTTAPTTAATTAPAATATTETAAATEVPAATEVVATEAITGTEAPAATKTTDSTGSVPAVNPNYAELVRAEAGEFKGTKVSIFGLWVEAEDAAFNQTLAAFEARTGIDVQYEGSKDFETLIPVRAEGGNAPDIAGFSQPGLMATLARKNKLVDISSFIKPEDLQKDYIQSWIDLGSVDNTLYGVFFRASTKSIVWYPVPAFEEAGYTIPQTWDEMTALSDKMVADGNTPWCIGLEHGNVTGWVATDWMEDIMLRTASPETYDKWVSHEIPFNDPSVKNAAEIMGKIWFNEQYVAGGREGILTTAVADTQTPMFNADKPGCWLHRQAGWIPSFFPEGKKAGTDSNFFYLPPIDPALGKPVLGGGDVFAMFNDRPEVRAVLQYLASPESAKGWVEAGGFISPNQSVDLAWYGNDIDRRQAEIIKEATVFRFDASDLMPAEVGVGTFWKGMVDYVNNTDIDTVLTTIEESWPKN